MWISQEANAKKLVEKSNMQPGSASDTPTTAGKKLRVPEKGETKVKSTQSRTDKP